MARRIAAVEFPVEMAYLDAARLPFESERFDTVVSTWTLVHDSRRRPPRWPRCAACSSRAAGFCSSNTAAATTHSVARRQDRWNGLQRVIGCGCNLNRPIDQLIEASGLRITRLERFLMPKSSRISADHYLGSAVRA